MEKRVKEEIREISLWEALLPVIVLVGLLAVNVLVYGDNALSGSNQFILILGATVAALVGTFKGISYDHMLNEVGKNIQSTSGALLILLFVGALAGTWLISGIIPAMIYYGLQILNPTFFLVATVIICAIISIATGSSWTTSATIGLALVGIGKALGIPAGMAAGAAISGAYFGDKMSPLSDTTNLAPAMAGTDLFTHIRYMTLTTVPTLIITLIAFMIIGLNLDVAAAPDSSALLASIDAKFHITPLLFIVPALVIALIVRKVPPLPALLVGTLLGGLFALIFQKDVVMEVSGFDSWSAEAAYKGVMNAITTSVQVATPNESLADLFSAKGMSGMLGTIFLIISAMVFGGVMDAIGALSKISKALLNVFDSVFGLFASTVASCLALNITASDQYLAIVVPGKMYAEAYKEKGLAPENLSRTLEDAGTVTSVLIPWNTCGAYQSSVLGVDTLSYLPYAIFNYVSPFMTLTFAALNIKIRQLVSN